VPVLIRTLETLLKCTADADARAFQSVLHYLDWRLRTMSLLPPVETFAYHVREYRSAAVMLVIASGASAAAVACMIRLAECHHPRIPYSTKLG
jgi:hypothetical protein